MKLFTSAKIPKEQFDLISSMNQKHAIVKNDAIIGYIGQVGDDVRLIMVGKGYAVLQFDELELIKKET